MNILVEEQKKEELKENKKISEEIICPECEENILIKIDNYRINLKGCKNGHNININYIIAEIYIKKEDINKDIKIINSFENFQK